MFSFSSDKLLNLFVSFYSLFSQQLFLVLRSIMSHIYPHILYQKLSFNSCRPTDVQSHFAINEKLHFNCSEVAKKSFTRFSYQILGEIIKTVILLNDSGIPLFLFFYNFPQSDLIFFIHRAHEKTELQGALERHLNKTLKSYNDIR